MRNHATQARSAVPISSWGAAGPPSPIGFNGCAAMRTCQFIAGEPSRWAKKCGEPVVKATSAYCAEHHAKCWQPISEARALKMMGLA